MQTSSASAVAGTDLIQDVYGSIIRSGSDYEHGGVDFRAPEGTAIVHVIDVHDRVVAQGWLG